MYLASHIEIFLIHCAAFHLELHNLAGGFSRRAAGHLLGRCVRVCASVCASVCGNFRECARLRKSWSVRTFVCTYMNLRFQIFGAIRSRGTSFVYVTRIQHHMEFLILLSYIFPIECKKVRNVDACGNLVRGRMPRIGVDLTYFQSRKMSLKVCVPTCAVKLLAVVTLVLVVTSARRALRAGIQCQLRPPRVRSLQGRVLARKYRVHPT